MLNQNEVMINAWFGAMKERRRTLFSLRSEEPAWK